MKYEIKTQNRKLFDDYKIIIKGLKSALSIIPKYTIIIFFEQLFPVVISYFSLYMTTLIINSIIEKNSIYKIFILAGITVIINFIFSFLKRLLKRESIVEKETVDEKILLNISRISSKLPYMYVEDPEIENCANLIAFYEKNWRGHKAFIDYLTRVFIGFFQVITSFSLTISMFKMTSINDNNGFFTFINSPYSAYLMSGIILFGSVSNLLLISKRNLYTNKIRNENKDILRKSKYYTELFMGTGAAEVRIYNESQMILQEIETSIFRHNFAVDIPKIECKFNLINACVRFILSICLYIYISAKAFMGVFPIGNFVLYRGAIEKFIFGVTQIVNNIGNLRFNIIPCLELYFEYKNLIETETQNDPNVMKKFTFDTIEFQDVNFRYPRTDKDILKNINIKLKSGEKIAVVGENGSGKTTFIKLLCGLYDVKNGKVKLNGNDLVRYEKEEYKRLFSVVFQDYQIFAFSLGENVSCTCDYDINKVRDLLILSGLKHRLENLPFGLCTSIGTEFDKFGVLFSGGELQKIALARALFKEAPFVILDEPTAALDPLSEAEIYESFNQMVEGKTAIYISHRLSSCRFCNRILVFDKGEIVQMGSHNELIADKTGKYYELWHAQSQYYEAE